MSAKTPGRRPIEPADLVPHYSRFRVGDRVLLTGHSHQAWPDVTEAAHARAWADAAEAVDEKWARAEAQADRVRVGYSRLLGDVDGTISLGASTHELLVRLLSALDWRTRRRIVTTDEEFHSARRQLDRLAEEGVEVVRIPTGRVDDLADALAAAVDDRTAAVVVSKVLFSSGRIVPGLDAVAAACRRHGTVCCVDGYHALNVVDWRPGDEDLDDAYVVGGGYKYVQAGEGNCFLRWPTGSTLRPVVTGWFAEFGELTQGTGEHSVGYGTGPERFAGSTYDPTSHYRAAAAFDFFADHDLDVDRLRDLSQHQVGRLRDGIAALDVDPARLRIPEVDVADLGGFLALDTPLAAELQGALARAGVHTDFRGRSLRLGPAPYVTDDQLDDAVTALADALADPRLG